MHWVANLGMSLSTMLPLMAQVPGCPYERARTVPTSWVTGPGGPCGSGVELELGGVTIKTPKTVCPLFVVITPTHEVSERSDRPTRTEVIGQVAEQTAFFRCDPDYLIFIYLGSSCVLDRIVVTGAVNRLVTKACVEADS